MAGSFCILNLHFCAFLFSHFCACCFKIPSASLEGIKNLEKPRKTLHTPKKKGNIRKKHAETAFLFRVLMSFLLVLHVLQFLLHLFCMFFAFFCFAIFLYFSSFPRGPAWKWQICKKKCEKKSEQIEKTCKKVAIPRFRKICCKSNAKKCR